MTYEGKNIADMNEAELTRALETVKKQLAKVRGHKLRDRLHSKKNEIEGRLAA